MQRYTSRGSLRGWFRGLGPATQLSLGCLTIFIAAIVMVYCAGTLSVLVRPILFEFAPTPLLPQPTFPPTATTTATFIALPRGTVPPTPTQGRIPTREPATPTLDPSISPTITLSATLGTPRATGTITRTTTATATRR